MRRSAVPVPTDAILREQWARSALAGSERTRSVRRSGRLSAGGARVWRASFNGAFGSWGANAWFQLSVGGLYYRAPRGLEAKGFAPVGSAWVVGVLSPPSPVG